MANVDPWQVVLLTIVGYVAVMGLVRLMLARRNEAIAELNQQIVTEQRRRQAQQRAQQEEAA